MSAGSGLRKALGEAVVWLAAAGALAAIVLKFDDVKRLTTAQHKHAFDLSETFARASASLSPASTVATAIQTGQTVTLRSAPNGHFYTNAMMNGIDVPVLVDTGASYVALPFEIAAQIGIQPHDLEFTNHVQTANGMARIAPILISSIEIGGLTVRNVQAAVSEPGAMRKALLGMSFLGRLHRAEIRRGELVLEN